MNAKNTDLIMLISLFQVFIYFGTYYTTVIQNRFVE